MAGSEQPIEVRLDREIYRECRCGWGMALVAELVALRAALAEAERARAADAAVLAALVEDQWAGFYGDPLEEQYSCLYCTAAVAIGNDVEPTVLPDHDDDCPLARARGILDARRAATTTAEDAGDDAP